MAPGARVVVGSTMGRAAVRRLGVAAGAARTIPKAAVAPEENQRAVRDAAVDGGDGVGAAFGRHGADLDCVPHVVADVAHEPSAVETGTDAARHRGEAPVGLLGEGDCDLVRFVASVHACDEAVAGEGRREALRHVPDHKGHVRQRRRKA